MIRAVGLGMNLRPNPSFKRTATKVPVFAVELKRLADKAVTYEFLAILIGGIELSLRFGAARKIKLK